MASSEQGNEFLTAFNQVRYHPFYVRIVLKRKGFESADALSPTELRNRKIDRSFAKHLAVVIQVPTLHAVVLFLIDCLLLFTVVVYDALWLASTGASRVDFRVWLEECPKQIIGDFTILQKQEKALSRRLVDCFEEVDQEIQVLEGCRIVCGARICVALIQFQFTEVVVQQVLFDLGSNKR